MYNFNKSKQRINSIWILMSNVYFSGSGPYTLMEWSLSKVKYKALNVFSLTNISNAVVGNVNMLFCFTCNHGSCKEMRSGREIKNDRKTKGLKALCFYSLLPNFFVLRPMVSACPSDSHSNISFSIDEIRSSWTIHRIYLSLLVCSRLRGFHQYQPNSLASLLICVCKYMMMM